MSQIRRKDQPILAPSQRTIENAEFLLIIKLGSDHLITGLSSFLECRTHFRYILTRTSDKNVIAMHRPSDGTQLVMETATRHSANGLQLPSPFPNSSPNDAAAGRELRTTPWAASQHALSGIRQAHCPATRQRSLSSLQRRNTVAERQTRLRQSSLSSRRAACAIAALTNAWSGNDHGTPGQPTEHVTEERHRTPYWL